jgi:hypothetical protein
LNAYAKIGIKVGVVFLICIILLVAYNMVGHRAIMSQVATIKTDLATQQSIKTQLDSLLAYRDELPNIRFVELKDMETLRAFMPPKETFVLTSYLRVIHQMLAGNHLDTSGIIIAPEREAPGGVSFEESFETDVITLAGKLADIMKSLELFKQNKGQMNNLLVSYQFYKAMASGTENFAAIVGGIERHGFTLTVRGSYDNIKKFTFDVFNMRPHTALVNFQMSPQGPGMGPTRVYQATFTIMTYADANPPPPLWLAYHQRGEEQPGELETAAEDSASVGEEPAIERPGLPETASEEPAPSDQKPEEPDSQGNENSAAGATVGGKPESGGTH